MSEAEGLIIEEDLPEDVQASVDEFTKGLESLEGDTPAAEGGTPAAEGDTTVPAVEGDAPATEPKAIDIAKLAESSGVPEADIREAIKRDMTFDVDTRKGKQTFSYEEASQYFNRYKTRDDSFQKKHNDLMSSEGEFIALRKAAESGDKKAIKSLVALANKYSGKETLDDLMDDIDATEGEFDLEGATNKFKEDFSKEDFFADVREDVDFQENMDKLEETFGEVVPPKLLGHYLSRDEDKRTLYSVLVSPLRDEILSGMEKALSSLTRESRLDVKSDPDKFALLFEEVVNGLPDEEPNNQQELPPTAPESRNEPPAKSALDSVSTGNRTKQTTDTGVPDFSGMTSREFAEYQEKLDL